MKRKAPVVHTTYLSTSNGKWRVIHNDQALCADKPNRQEAEAAAVWFGLVPTAVWNGDTSTMEPLVQP